MFHYYQVATGRAEKVAGKQQKLFYVEICVIVSSERTSNGVWCPMADTCKILYWQIL